MKKVALFFLLCNISILLGNTYDKSQIWKYTDIKLTLQRQYCDSQCHLQTCEFPPSWFRLTEDEWIPASLFNKHLGAHETHRLTVVDFKSTTLSGCSLDKLVVWTNRINKLKYGDKDYELWRSWVLAACSPILCLSVLPAVPTAS